jgi:ethanolamine utilization protein EutQ (cupin superfamily)
MGIQRKNIDSADEVRTFEHGKVEMITLGDVMFGRSTFDPGWRWSECVKPIAGTESCEFHHRTFIVSGRLHIRLDDGSEDEAGPGDVLVIPPGHDAWVVGDEPCVAIDFDESTGEYAKPK